MKRPLTTAGRYAGAPDLLVLLPGACMRAEDYAAAGFFAAVEARRLALDVVAVDLDLAAISAGEALPALCNDILAPARTRYRRVCLGGISLGGMLALAQAAETPESIDGLCLIAPYPGSRLTLNVIDHAGGLDVWAPSAEDLADPELRVWDWLRQPPAALPAFVGWGGDDRFAAGMAAIARRFPGNAHCMLPGGHDWPVWVQLWDRFLDRNPFAVGKAGEPA